MLTYLATSIVGFIVCAALADGKNRSVPAWGALGYLLPLIGVIAVALVRPLPPDRS